MCMQVDRFDGFAAPRVAVETERDTEVFEGEPGEEETLASDCNCIEELMPSWDTLNSPNKLLK